MPPGSNGTALSDMTLDELKALLSALQQERATLESSAKAAGMTADEIKKYPSNAELQQAINEKQKAQREDLIKQIQKYDPSYDGSNKTLEQLVADLKAKQEAEQQKQNLINEIKTYDSNYDGTGQDARAAAERSCRCQGKEAAYRSHCPRFGNMTPAIPVMASPSLSCRQTWTLRKQPMRNNSRRMLSLPRSRS